MSLSFQFIKLIIFIVFVFIHHFFSINFTILKIPILFILISQHLFSVDFTNLNFNQPFLIFIFDFIAIKSSIIEVALLV